MVRNYLDLVEYSTRRGEPYSDADKEEVVAAALVIIGSARSRVASLESAASQGRWHEVYHHAFVISDKYVIWGYYRDLLLAAKTLTRRLAAVANEVIATLLGDRDTDPARRDAIGTLVRESAEAAVKDWPICLDAHLTEGVAEGRLFPPTAYVMRLRFLVEDERARPVLLGRLRDADLPAQTGALRQLANAAVADMEAVLSAFRDAPGLSGLIRPSPPA
jgi:hypothetical protein